MKMKAEKVLGTSGPQIGLSESHVGAFYLSIHFLSSPEDIFSLFLERGREKEKHTSIGCLLYTPRPGVKPTTQVRALIWNCIRILSVMG